MEQEYTVRLRRTDGAWSGVLQTPEGDLPFNDLRDLWLRLDMDPYPQLERLEKLVRTDPLTGLLNRMGLEEEAGRMLASGQGRAVLVLLDVDDLKRINDTWGHRQGDRALRTVASILAQVPSGTAGRISGDEFVLLLPEPGEGDLQALGSRICEAVAGAAPEIGLSVSAGACLQAPGRDYQWMLEGADRAMYHIKSRGKGRFAAWDCPETQD